MGPLHEGITLIYGAVAISRKNELFMHIMLNATASYVGKISRCSGPILTSLSSHMVSRGV